MRRDDPAERLRAENEELRARLEEAEATLNAIRAGAVDAVVVAGPDGHRVYTLEGADQFYRALIEAMQPGQGAASLSADGTVLYGNRSLAALVGAPPEKVGGRVFAEFVAPPDRPAWDAVLRAAQTGCGRGELWLQPAARPPVPVHVAVNGLPLTGAVALGMVVTDLTERRRQEETERRLVREEAARAAAEEVARLAREADQKKDEFLAVLAHELRNPLAPIRNGLQVLRLTGGIGPSAERTRGMMERQVGQLARLIDDLMDVSRIRQGKIVLRRERLSLAAVVASAVETSRPLVDEMGHALTVALPSAPIAVDADETRLAQVFMNLLNNAAKYTERGGRITLTAATEGPEVVVSVKDTGVGIAADQLPRVFEMFSQIDRSLGQAQGGLGIGLSLVKRLVEMHGGTIEARSDGPGLGAEFVVRLPGAAEVSDPHAGAAAGPTAGTSALRVLVVDDNRDGADSLAEMLAAMGNDTHTAYDGEEAVAAVAAFRPDAVLLDLGLPKLDGYEVCRRIRGAPGGDKLLVIAQTGWGQDEDRRRTKAAGFDHHLVKPVDPATLLALLAGAARG